MTRHRHRRVAAGVAALLACALSAGCGSAGSTSDGEVVVFAASSLTEVFERLGAQFEQENPGTEITFSFGASSALAQQVLAGAPADVLATADPRTMRQAADGGAVSGEPVRFATNRLQIAVPPDNPGRVTALADLADPALVLALCDDAVPCGAAARELLDQAGISVRPDTLEEDVKAVLAKVRLGEVDAGLVYHTDVRAAGEAVHGIEVPKAARAANAYEIAPVTDADPTREFVDLVLSERGREVLSDAGFDLP